MKSFNLKKNLNFLEHTDILKIPRKLQNEKKEIKKKKERKKEKKQTGGLVSWLSFTNHSDSESFLVVHALLSQEWMPAKSSLGGGRTKGIAFDLSQTLPVIGVLFVPCF